jgi:hypothetical protein
MTEGENMIYNLALDDVELVVRGDVEDNMVSFKKESNRGNLIAANQHKVASMALNNLIAVISNLKRK